MILAWSGIFIVSLLVLILSADRFTVIAERLGLRLGISQFIIGVTVVSVGTSLPELLTSIIAVIQTTPALDTTQVVIGDALGSNIANIFLVLGIAALVARKLEVKRSLIELDLPFLMLTTGLLAFIIIDGTVTWAEGVILLVAYAIYLRYSMSQHEREDLGVDEQSHHRPWYRRWFVRPGKETGRDLFYLVLLAIVLYFGAKFTVDAIVELSSLLGIATSVIAVSAVAIGTSLPEVAVSVSAARRGKYDIAVGNVVGSCVFNALVVVGIPSLITTILVPSEMLVGTLPFFIGAALLYTISGISRRLYSFEGGMYLLLYGLFLGKLFGLL